MEKKKNNENTGAPQRERRTYGVKLMEWHALIPAGHGTVRVRFTGGACSGFGQKPATYTTTDPVMMRLIEDSHHFRTGFIFTVRTRKIPER